MHFLLLGLSHEHVEVEINAHEIKHAILITSENLYSDAKSFSKTLEKSSVIIHEIVCVNPFGSTALDDMTDKFMSLYEKYSDEFTIICGLTGGTNLMAISMALCALRNNLQCHYCVNDEVHTVYDIHYLQRLHRRLDL